LRPFEVSVPNLDKWELQDPTNPGAPALLRLWLREPLHEGELKVHCLAPLGEPGTRGPVAWTSPGVRVAGAVQGGETLELYFHPDLRLDDWQPGHFRVTRSATQDGRPDLHLDDSMRGPARAARPPAEEGRTQKLVLSGGGVEVEGAAA